MKKIIFFLSFLFSALFAQGPLNYLTSTDGGSAYEIFFHNNYLYVGCANTLEVWDLTGANATLGNLRFKKRMLSNIDYITEHNGYLYVCANHDGLYKFDLSMTPDSLIEKAHFVPANINESVYDIGFYGSDTVIVAAKNKINMMKENLTSFTYLNTIATAPATGRIRGLDIKNNFLAYTVAFAPGFVNGVYLYDINTMSVRDSYLPFLSAPLEIYFGQNNNLLHVMGGGNFLSVNGNYYVLDYTDPDSLQLQFGDTIKGFGFPIFSFSTPMNAKIINDTIYIATQGGGPIGYTLPDPFYGEVYVYDATDSSNIHLLTDIYSGLYHFDIDINEATRKMYVASEWYGIWTVDVNDIYNEIVYPKKHTGGWCHGSTYNGDRLVEANEGYGIRMFDVSVIQNPLLIHEDTTGGFCRAISLSDSADFVYSWFLTGKKLRIHDGNSLVLLADTSFDIGTIAADYKKSRYQNGKVAVIEDLGFGNTKIRVADVHNNLQPYIEFTGIKKNTEDILWHSSGALFACSNDSIIVYDTTSWNMAEVIVPPGGNLQKFKTITLMNDTLYVFSDSINEGISRYFYNPSFQTLTYINSTSYPMNSHERIFLTCDAGLLYITSTVDQLKAITKTTCIPVAVYDHGADFINDNLWGLHDLYYKNGYLFLNEYMGQTSIFGAPNTISIEEITEKDLLIIYPNPTTDYFTIHIGSLNESLIKIYSLDGKLVYSANLFTDNIKLSCFGWENGVYLVSIIAEGKERTAKLIVNK